MTATQITNAANFTHARPDTVRIPKSPASEIGIVLMRYAFLGIAAHRCFAIMPAPSPKAFPGGGP